MSHCIIVAEKMEPKLFSSEMKRVKLWSIKFLFVIVVVSLAYKTWPSLSIEVYTCDYVSVSS